MSLAERSKDVSTNVRQSEIGLCRLGGDSRPRD